MSAGKHLRIHHKGRETDTFVMEHNEVRAYQYPLDSWACTGRVLDSIPAWSAGDALSLTCHKLTYGIGKSCRTSAAQDAVSMAVVYMLGLGLFEQCLARLPASLSGVVAADERQLSNDCSLQGLPSDQH